MKKQIVAVQDIKTKKIVQICSVLDVDSEQFEKLETEAKKISDKVVSQEELEREREIGRINRKFNDMQKEIDGLKLVIAHLLGWEELDEETLEKILGRKAPHNE